MTILEQIEAQVRLCAEQRIRHSIMIIHHDSFDELMNSLHPLTSIAGVHNSPPFGAKLKIYGHDFQIYRSNDAKGVLFLPAPNDMQIADTPLPMTHSEKLEYMRLALAICGYGFPTKDLDLFVSLYDQIIEKSGEVGLKEVVALEAEIKARYEPSNPEQ